jgi:hypothetical protein
VSPPLAIEVPSFTDFCSTYTMIKKNQRKESRTKIETEDKKSKITKRNTTSAFG